MEVYTLAFSAGLRPLDWQSGDCLHYLSVAPAQLPAPYIPRGEDQIYGWKHLRMETFTLAFPDGISPLDCVQSVCTKPRGVVVPQRSW